MKVLYHANCADGFCSAYILWTLFPGATFTPCHYGQPLILRDFKVTDTILMVDFSYKRDQLIKIANKVKKVIIYDHHKTAMEDLEAGLPHNVSVTFDMGRAGCEITWEEMRKNTAYPNLIKYVADRDLWRWELPKSKEVSAYIASVPFDFNTWLMLEKDLQEYMPLIVAKGEAILAFQNKQIEASVAAASDAQLIVPGMGTFVIPAVNTTVNFSEVAGKLAEGRSFAVCWFMRKDGKFQYSLRSSEEGLDVSEIAKALGGGGHPRAAGFQSDELRIFNHGA